MNKLVQAIQSTPTMTQTANGAITFNSTTSKVLDLFSRGGALRTRSESEVTSLFSAAYNEDKLLALKCLFYLRDIRGGQGERKVFRTCLKWLVENDAETFVANFDNVALFGRYDDVLHLLDTPAEKAVSILLHEQLVNDTHTPVSDSISLLAKWMPSSNTSSINTRRLAKKLMKNFGWNPKKYRKTLSALRARINIVEANMCANNWEDIEFSSVPSRASMIYRKAFRKHDTKRYEEWQTKVASGTAKINAATLFPYDLVRESEKFDSDPSNRTPEEKSSIKTLDLQWKNLPDYLKKNPHNGLVVADVSGSMNGLPMQVSISMAMYFAERNVGSFKDYFITFSGQPTLQKVVGKTIVDKVQNLSRADWEQNTNLQAVFELILNAATKDSVPASEMPSMIYIVSDMEFDTACEDNSSTNFQAIEKKYKTAGYERPNICFWNVSSTSDQSPVTKDQRGTTLVSGCSPSTFQHVMEGSTMTPYEFMLGVLNVERYETVIVE